MLCHKLDMNGCGMVDLDLAKDPLLDMGVTLGPQYGAVIIISVLHDDIQGLNCICVILVLSPLNLIHYLSTPHLEHIPE